LENAKGAFLYFLPKPLHLNLVKTDHPKDLKKIQFISKEVWALGLNPNDWKTKCKIIDKRFVVTQAEFDDFELSEQAVFFKEIALPKVTVHQESKEKAFFYQTTIQIMPLNENLKVHYYFLLETQDLADSESKICVTAFV
jgi:CRISPR type III-A-associated RAMP protein Csm4